MQPEHELVSRAKAGDKQAFEQLVELNSGKVYAAAYRILGDQQQAEDCVQEAFLKVYLKLGSFKQQSKFSTWLYSIAVNEALDFRRKNQKHTKQSDYDLDQLSSNDENNPEKAAWIGNINDAAQGALDHLSDDIRAAFVLRHYQGCSINEITEILGINANTAKSRVFRAIKRLRELLHAKVGDYETLD